MAGTHLKNNVQLLCADFNDPTDQEVGHALALTNILGADRAAKQCVYQYPFTTVAEFVLFCQLLTRFGESGVYGFLPHLDSRPSAQILLQSITTVCPPYSIKLFDSCYIICVY